MKKRKLAASKKSPGSKSQQQWTPRSIMLAGMRWSGDRSLAESRQRKRDQYPLSVSKEFHLALVSGGFSFLSYFPSKANLIK